MKRDGGRIRGPVDAIDAAGCRAGARGVRPEARRVASGRTRRRHCWMPAGKPTPQTLPTSATVASEVGIAKSASAVRHGEDGRLVGVHAVDRPVVEELGRHQLRRRQAQVLVGPLRVGRRGTGRGAAGANDAPGSEPAGKLENSIRGGGYRHRTRFRRRRSRPSRPVAVAPVSSVAFTSHARDADVIGVLDPVLVQVDEHGARDVGNVTHLRVIQFGGCGAA